ncbi:MAG: VWA domain-containing protein [Candidatus Omnitrophica bacterium]|nr:VWA domain-containing protein [Candidatus Omnitrophota bacterium]MDD5488681.1 VWA domain-containing protein [Candidatus Omnitrophota bacterium]
MTIIFRTPLALSLLFVVLALFILLRMRGHVSGIIFPADHTVRALRGNLRAFVARNIYLLRWLALLLLIAGLARPQFNKEGVIRKEGIAIVMSVDCSSTMTAGNVKLGFEDIGIMGDKNVKDLSRIDAVKSVAIDFARTRKDDMIGLVAFAAEAFVACPPTFDHEWLVGSIDRLKVGMIKDGTAIGSGILSALNSLKDVEAKGKIIILLTDGINNYGKVPPLIAAKAARALGIKIYTIGLVSDESLEFAGDGSGRKVYKGGNVAIDEKQLEDIAATTGGKYYRAENMATLKESYKDIDAVEKVRIEQESYLEYVDVFSYFLWGGLFLLLLECILRNTFFRKVP